MELDLIWYDSEALNGRGMPGDYAAEEQNLGPANARPCPCDPCELSSLCNSEMQSCAAFRSWCNKGDYTDDSLRIKMKAL
jgi:hypothetical protein